MCPTVENQPPVCKKGPRPGNSAPALQPFFRENTRCMQTKLSLEDSVVLQYSLRYVDTYPFFLINQFRFGIILHVSQFRPTTTYVNMI